MSSGMGRNTPKPGDLPGLAAAVLAYT
jgi:hypothetical protein